MGKLQSYMRRFTLTLVLKKQWYDMIASGEKVEEYRGAETILDKTAVCRLPF